MKYLIRQMKRYRLHSLLAPAFKMLEACFDLLVPIVVAQIINVGVAQGDTGYIVRRSALMVGMALIGLICSFTAQYFSAKAATGCATGLRHELFSHIQSLGFSEMDRLGVSTLITRMTSDINQVQNGVNLFLRLFLRSPFIVFGALFMAFTISPRIASVFAATIAALAVIVFALMGVTAPRYREIQSHLDRVTTLTRENLAGVRVIRAFGREEKELEDFSVANTALRSRQLHAGRLSALMSPLTFAAANLCVILILRQGGLAVHQGALLAGSVIALVNYMSQILIELIKLADLIVTLSRSMASMGRVAQILDTPRAMDFGESLSASPSAEAVRFEHVNLQYDMAGAESLTDISFSVPMGQTVGVIGGTGSGKTTLASLIPRFYDATSGEVYLMGAPIEKWSKEALRRRIGVAPQRALLFSGTIRSNLLWGNENARDEELWAALRAAQAEEFVKAKPLGLDEKVEQGGLNFSGGQRQRLTIARALVGKPDILILDDSSSALDYATDAALRQSLASLPWPHTTFIVSQRASSLRHAGQIIVLEDGRLAGIGSHEQLLSSCQVYREIHESQFQKGDERA